MPGRGRALPSASEACGRPSPHGRRRLHRSTTCTSHRANRSGGRPDENCRRVRRSLGHGHTSTKRCVPPAKRDMENRPFDEQDSDKDSSAGEPTTSATGAGYVWVTSGSYQGEPGVPATGGVLSKIDLRPNRIVATIKRGFRPDGVVVANGLVWLAVAPR